MKKTRYRSFGLISPLFLSIAAGCSSFRASPEQTDQKDTGFYAHILYDTIRDGGHHLDAPEPDSNAEFVLNGLRLKYISEVFEDPIKNDEIDRFLDDIETLSVREKIDAIHTFSKSFLKPKTTDSFNFSRAISDRSGDCHDYSWLNLYLLVASNLKLNQLFHLAINSYYPGITPPEDALSLIDHAVAAVVLDNGDIIVMDHNMARPLPLSPDLTCYDPGAFPEILHINEIAMVLGLSFDLQPVMSSNDLGLLLKTTLDYPDSPYARKIGEIDEASELNLGD